MKPSHSLTFILILFCTIFASSSPSTDPQLKAVFDEEWKFRLAENPLFATSVGNHDYGDRLPSVTKEDEARRDAFYKKILKKLKQIERNKLNQQDQISYDLFQNFIEDSLASFEFQAYLIPLNADSGFHTDFARLPRQVPLKTVKDYENYIARLRAFKKYVDQNIVLMREGLRTGMTLPAVVLDGFEVTVTTHIVDDPTKSIFFSPLKSFPDSISDSHHERLRRDAASAISEGVVSGYRSFLEFMQKEYIPKTRRTLGASALPNGKKYYEYLVRYYTTLPLTPEEVHQTGLREVQRIRKEMEEIIRSVQFKGEKKMLFVGSSTI